MSHEICSLSLIAMQHEETGVSVECHIDFDGDIEDMAIIFANLFDAFELNDREALAIAAAALVKRAEENDND